MELLLLTVDEIYNQYINNNRYKYNIFYRNDLIDILYSPLLSSLYQYLRQSNNTYLIHQNVLKIIRHIILKFSDTISFLNIYL